MDKDSVVMCLTAPVMAPYFLCVYLCKDVKKYRNGEYSNKRAYK